MTSPRFEDLVDAGVLEIGDGYRAKNEELGGNGPIFLRAGHVTNTFIDFTGVERFWAHLEPIVASKMSRPGDTIITTKGNSTGRTSYVTDEMPPFVYSPHLSYWRSLRPDALVPGFLRYWARGPEFQDQLDAMKGSTDMAPYLSLIDQRRLRITIPDPGTQKAIASTLGALDTKIDFNRRMNRTLEEPALALFKSWFVEFDPVQAKRDGREPIGLPASALPHFPDHFEDSSEGPIPRGWSIKTLGAVASLTKGKSYRSDELRPSTTALVTLKSFRRGGGYRTDGLKEYLGTYKTTQVLSPGELVVACTDVTQAADVVGRAVRVLPDNRYRCLVASLDTIIVRPVDPELSVTWLAELLSTDAYISHAIGHANGTTVLHLASEALPTYPFVKPPEQLVRLFDDIAEPLYQRRVANEEENLALEQLRDALLPALLSREITLARSEKSVTEIA